MAKLVGMQGAVEGKEFALEESAVIGRSFNANVRIDDLTVSRSHAKVTKAARGFMIADLGSGNGTILNGAFLRTPTPLRNGDKVQISQNVFRFEEREAARPATGSSTTVSLSTREKGEHSTIVNTVDVAKSLEEVSAALAETDPRALVESHKRLRTVIEVSNAIQAEFDLDRLLGEIMDRLFDVFANADRGFVMLRESEGAKELTPKVVKIRGTKQPPKQISLSQHIVDEVMNKRVGILSADAMGDQRFAAAASVINFQIRSIMCVPLVARDVALGFISIDSQRPGISFSALDLELLTALGNVAASAISNATMHQRLLKRERVERDLQLAQQVQHSFLPDAVPEAETMSFCASYRSAMEVGGDFYDFIKLAENRIGVVVGDVSGKGVPAALLMARMTSDVRFFALTEKEPHRVVDRLNAGLVARPAGDAFVTLMYIDVDLATGKMIVVNAAHPPVVVRRAAEGEVLELTDAIGFPIGVVEGVEYEQQDFQLEQGDAVAVFTDGVTEAMNSSGDIYGTERVRESVSKGPSDPDSVMTRLLDDIKRHVGETPQSDDLTLVCFGPK